MLEVDAIDRLRTLAIASVRAFARSNGLPRSRLAKLAGLSINTLNGMDSPDWQPAQETLRALDKAMREFKAKPEPAASPAQPQDAA